MAPKRKRTATATSNDTTAHATDDAADTAPDAGKQRKSRDPPSKRTRGRGRADDVADDGIEEDGDVEVGGEGGGAEDEEERGGEQGEAGTMRMDAPPIAGSVQPVGYKTNAPPEGRAVRVYADGVFDLFHLGHMRQLQQAKTAFPSVHLMVGVTGDKETHKRKGLTVLSAKERAESVRHCRWVDEVVEDCPWIITVEFLQRHGIDYVAHDDLPYGASEGDDIYKPIKERGMFLVTQRTEGVSTTGIITKIVRDYEQYLARQLRRGTSRQELNISWFKKNEMDMRRHVAELRDNIRTNWTTTGQEVSRELRQFWTPSRASSPAGGGPAAGPAMGHGASGGGGRGTPNRERGGKNTDFAAGYAMGLIGGVKGWMQGSNRQHLSDGGGHSPYSDGEASGTNNLGVGSNGRSRHGRGKSQEEAVSQQLEAESGA